MMLTLTLHVPIPLSKFHTKSFRVVIFVLTKALKFKITPGIFPLFTLNLNPVYRILFIKQKLKRTVLHNCMAV